MNNLNKEEKLILNNCKDRIAPLLTGYLEKASPELFSIFNGNCARQVSIMCRYYLREKLSYMQWEIVDVLYEFKGCSFAIPILFGKGTDGIIIVNLNGKISFGPYQLECTYIDKVKATELEDALKVITNLKFHRILTGVYKDVDDEIEGYSGLKTIDLYRLIMKNLNLQ